MSEKVENQNNKFNPPIGRIVFGIIIILVGILFLLETTNTYSTIHILRYFPSLLILLGIWMLAKSRLQALFGPILLILVGLVWQLVTLDYLTWGQLGDFWPVILILIGVSLIVGRYRARVKESKTEYTSAFGIFGDVKKRNKSKNFSGGDLTGIFSDIELDLRDAEVKTKPARIHSACVFGDIDIIVPENWNVELNTLSIFADAVDKRHTRENKPGEADLIIDGWVLFGDVCIKD